MKGCALVFLFSVLILLSCAKGYGTAYVSGDVSIYYYSPEDLNQVKALAEFWNRNNLSNKKKQFLRIVKTDKGNYQLQLIAFKSELAQRLKFDEIKLLQGLENKLNKEVFTQNKIDLVICDSRFTVLNDLNF
jgi:hypothetical protein